MQYEWLNYLHTPQTAPVGLANLFYGSMIVAFRFSARPAPLFSHRQSDASLPRGYPARGTDARSGLAEHCQVVILDWLL